MSERNYEKELKPRASYNCRVGPIYLAFVSIELEFRTRLKKRASALLIVKGDVVIVLAGEHE